MIKSICTFSLVVICFLANGQNYETSAPKTDKLFYTEAGGPGVLFSANLDGRFKAGNKMGWGFRAGLGFTLVDVETRVDNGNQPYYTSKTRSVATLPVGINYVFGKTASASMFEVGAGITALSRKVSILNYNEYKDGNFLGHFSFMYRRQPIDGGFSWRVGFTPIINPDGDIFPFGAIGLGYAFR